MRFTYVIGKNTFFCFKIVKYSPEHMEECSESDRNVPEWVQLEYKAGIFSCRISVLTNK